MLADFWLYVSIAGIQSTKAILKSIDILDLKIALSDRFYAFHHLDQPTSCLLFLVPQKECSVPLGKNRFFRLKLTGANNEDFP